VSEGVDVPRLAVGVYATTTGTPLYFAQAVGRSPVIEASSVA
jgi:superfamily II DNA or RNA helicase